jgi:hypothetical protein
LGYHKSLSSITLPSTIRYFLAFSIASLMTVFATQLTKLVYAAEVIFNLTLISCPQEAEQVFLSQYEPGIGSPQLTQLLLFLHLLICSFEG